MYKGFLVYSAQAEFTVTDCLAKHNRRYMNKKNIHKFLQSFVAVPLLATTMSVGGVSVPNATLLALGQNNDAIEASLITPEEAAIRKAQAEKIDAYFASRNSPLEGYGAKFVEEAYKNDLDPNLLPAIATRESNAGKQACKNPKAPNNNFGWFSCKRGFSSINESIEY